MTTDAAEPRHPDGSLAVLGGGPLGQQDPATVGRYRIHALLGIGGMGRVYLAWAPDPGPAPGRSGAWVAVKVIRPDLADIPQFRRRFARELEAVGRVRSPYAAALVDGDPEAPQPWMATEFVPGIALADAMGPGEPLPEPSVWRLAHNLGSALSAAHQAGFVHRDVKPSNVILSSVGAKIIDFGVAHASDLSQLTATGMNIGTPSYMAPEQAKAGEVSSASDMFSLGALLYFAATGRLPFGEGGTAEVLFRVVYEEPDLSGLDRLEPTLRDLILRCMAKVPSGRPNAAGAVVMSENAAAAGLWNAQEAAAWPEGLALRISERTHAAGRTLPDPSLHEDRPRPAAAEASPPVTYQLPESPLPLPPPPVDSIRAVYNGSRDGSARRQPAIKQRLVLLSSISAVAVLGLGVAAYAVSGSGSHAGTNTASAYASTSARASGTSTSSAAPGIGSAGRQASSSTSASASASASGATRAPADAVNSGTSADSSAANGAGGVAASDTPGHPSTTTSTVESTAIREVDSGLCLSVTGASTAAGATADLYTCNGSVSENWKINPSGAITGGNSGLCLSVSGNSTALKSTADINTCDGDTFERWTVESGGTIVNDDGQCLSVSGASPALYATADLYTCNGSVSENWTVQ